LDKVPVSRRNESPAATNKVDGSGIAVMVKVLPSKEELPKPPVPLKVKPVIERLFVVWKTRELPWLKLAMLRASKALGYN